MLIEKISPETTIEEAIHLSGVLEQFPEIDLKNNKVGVFGKLKKLDSTLLENDRIEIYRPLIADPKESRRKRAAKKDKVKSDQKEV
ncbi:MAG: RnfH family protein [Thiohalomonadales bacterium]